MKITLKPREVAIAYPTLMMPADEPSTVVLMFSRDHGVIVASQGREVGYYSENWDMRLLRPFVGTITMES
jgi:hypothetical protein